VHPARTFFAASDAAPGEEEPDARFAVLSATLFATTTWGFLQLSPFVAGHIIRSSSLTQDEPYVSSGLSIAFRRAEASHERAD
jgi:hypothetical protein